MILPHPYPIIILYDTIIMTTEAAEKRTTERQTSDERIGSESTSSTITFTRARRHWRSADSGRRWRRAQAAEESERRGPVEVEAEVGR